MGLRITGVGIILPHDYNNYNYLAQLYVDCGQENLIPTMVASLPRDNARDIYFVWGMANRYKGDKARAAEILKMTLDSFPTFPDAFREYTRLLYEAGDIDRLRQVVERWLTNNPDDVDARRLLENIERKTAPRAIPGSGSGS